jgi:2-hydroxy-6-oxonona-2,4-dienedioate hydrolase
MITSDAHQIYRKELSTASGRVVWHLAGSGPPLVLIHGGTGSWTHWLRVIPELATDFRLLMPDLPGFGESELPPGLVDPEDLATALCESLHDLLPDKPRLPIVGFSFGSLVAGLLAEQMGQRVERLILVGASGLGLRGSFRLPLQRWRNLPPTEREPVHRHNLAILMLCDADAITAETLEIHAKNAEAARFNSRPISAGAYLRDSLRRSPQPLGAIWGSADAVARHDMTDRIAILRDVDPDCTVTVIPNAGHWVAHERPVDFAAALRSMINT